MRAPDETITIFPALRGYLDRIGGAEQRNFRRYVIREEAGDGYSRDRFIIKLAADGAVSVTASDGSEVPEEIKPTEDEQAAIETGLAAAGWPNSINATEGWVDRLREQEGRDVELFVFRNERGEVTFVQQRIRRDDGSKTDLPWSFWSDGRWRMMQPDGDLPLWGLEKLKVAAVVFVHEGASTAMKVVRMIEETRRTATIDPHPWFRHLEHAAHIGWPGGAPNAHHVEWGPLRRLPPNVRVIVVCDNDPPGEEAAPVISRALQRKMQIVRFGAGFPRGFDLADEFPEDGPSLDDCLEPGTWATTAGKRKKLRAVFVEEWMFSITPDTFINRAQLHRRYSPGEFNNMLAAFSDVPNVAGLLRKHNSARAAQLVYEPGLKSGRIAFEGQQVINIYQPSPIKPIEGDVTLWEDFLAHLVPAESDRIETMRWCATLIARPKVHMSYAMLNISDTQGVGKTTLADILVQLVGEGNCSFPTPSEVIDSQFTYWLAFKLLAVIGEIYDGHRAKGYNMMKTYITDRNVWVHMKYDKPFQIRNCIHFLASSNSFRALKISDQDRRWFVPGIAEEEKPHAYWVTLRRWLASGGLNAIAYWAQEYVKQKGKLVETGVHAPLSETKMRAIEETRSDGERIIAELAQDLADDARMSPPVKRVLRLDEVRDWLAYRKASTNHKLYGNDGKRLLETPERIASIMRGHGLALVKHQFRAPVDPQHPSRRLADPSRDPGTPSRWFKSANPRFRIVANFPVDATEPGWEDLSEHYCALETF